MKKLLIIEILYHKILKFFGKKKDTSVIPKGMYCYVFNGENGVLPDGRTYQGITMCPYYRYGSKGNTACTFIPWYGFEPGHYDQCKICGINDNIENDES